MVIMLILCSIVSLAQPFDAKEVPDPSKVSEQEWKDYVEQNPQEAFNKYPEEAVKANPDLVLGNPQRATTFFSDPAKAAERVRTYPTQAKTFYSDSTRINSQTLGGYRQLLMDDPTQASQHPDSYRAAIGENPQLLNEVPAAATQNFFSSQGVTMSVGGNFRGYDRQTKTFSTGDGSTFTTDSLKGMGPGYTFTVKNDALIINGPKTTDPSTGQETQQTYTCVGCKIEPGSEANPQSSITSGCVDLTNDNKCDVSPQAGSNLFLGDAGITIPKGNRMNIFDDKGATYAYTGSQNQDLLFTMGNGGCVAKSNCVDITSKKLSISNTGEPPAAIDFDFNVPQGVKPGQGPFDDVALDLKGDGTAIKLTEHQFKDGKETKTTSLSFKTDKDVDCKGALMFDSIKKLDISIEGDPKLSYTKTCNDQGVCSGGSWDVLPCEAGVSVTSVGQSIKILGTIARPTGEPKPVTCFQVSSDYEASTFKFDNRAKSIPCPDDPTKACAISMEVADPNNPGKTIPLKIKRYQCVGDDAQCSEGIYAVEVTDAKTGKTETVFINTKSGPYAGGILKACNSYLTDLGNYYTSQANLKTIPPNLNEDDWNRAYQNCVIGQDVNVNNYGTISQQCLSSTNKKFGTKFEMRQLYAPYTSINPSNVRNAAAGTRIDHGVAVNYNNDFDKQRKEQQSTQVIAQRNIEGGTATIVKKYVEPPKREYVASAEEEAPTGGTPAQPQPKTNTKIVGDKGVDQDSGKECCVTMNCVNAMGGWLGSCIQCAGTCCCTCNNILSKQKDCVTCNPVPRTGPCT